MADGTIRLFNGTNFNSGNLEIYHDGIWGAICSQGFSGGGIACQQLGFIDEENYYCCSEFGRHNGTFWLHNVRCDGEEKKLIDCKFDSYNTTCSPNNVVGIRCRCKLDYFSNKLTFRKSIYFALIIRFYYY